MIVTRLAPSPTSNFLHLGNIRTMLYNYFLAKQSGGKFLVRLEDTDRDRYNPDFLKYFKDTLDWLGIEPDASFWNPDPTIGSFVQSERDYSDKVNYLIDNGLAYYAFDTKDQLDSLKNSGLKYDATTRMTMRNSLTMSKSDFDLAIKTEPYVIRFAVTPDVDITFDDAILGSITINTNTLDDKVLIKSNGIGSYHLCNVCDDHDMGVTHVLRGNEWVNSTPFHVILYKAFGWDLPTFAHLPLIMADKGKLSKRTAAKLGIPIAPLSYTDDKGVTHKGWKEMGYDPKSFMNALALIGWSPGNDIEIMDMDQMINLFSLDRVHKGGAKIDMDKAKWINSQHLRATSNCCLKPFLNIKDDRYSDDKIDMIIDLAKERSEFKYQLNDTVSLFFNDPIITDTKKLDDNFSIVFDKFIKISNKINFDSPDDIKSKLLSICDDLGIKIGKVMPGLRMALVGGVSGPDLPTIASILGRSETCNRISKCLSSSPQASM
jgi:glutamyl-tRNA synthetase